MCDLEFENTHLPLLTYKKTYPKNNVCYIILTCEKYLNTRVKWQNETCFKDVPEKDCYFLSCKEVKPNIYGWDTEDDYKSCIIKYIKFFQNLTINYDWYMFIDDDTYVFANRVEQYLSNYDKSEALYIGVKRDHIPDIRYTSGGAGFFITNPTYNLLKTHLSEEENTTSRVAGYEIYGDVTFGLWIREIHRSTNKSIKLIADGNNLNSDVHKSVPDILRAVTFHYAVSESQFKRYDKYKYVVDYTIANPIKSLSLQLKSELTIGSSKGTMMRHCEYKLLENKYVDNNRDFIFIIHKFPKGYVIESNNYPKHFITPNTDGSVYIKEGNCQDNKWQIKEYGGAFYFRALSPNPNIKDRYLAFDKETVLLSTTPCPLSLLVFPKLL